MAETLSYYDRTTTRCHECDVPTTTERTRRGPGGGVWIVYYVCDEHDDQKEEGVMPEPIRLTMSEVCQMADVGQPGDRLFLIQVGGQAVTAADLRYEHTQEPIVHEVVTVFAPSVERALQWHRDHYPEAHENRPRPYVLAWELKPRFGYQPHEEV